jgi:predicted aspartyl protease
MTTKTINYRSSINGDFAVVPVIFIKPKLIRAYALIDTGAAYSVFKSEVGKELGIDVHGGEQKPLIVGNGQIMNIYVHKQEVIICGKRIKDAEIGFSDELKTGFNILGRKTIFDQFEICFNDKDKVVRFHY